MKEETKNLEMENYVLARMIFIQSQIQAFVHGGWDEFEEEAKSLEQKIHALWRQSGREDAPTRELILWAQGQGISY